MTEDKKISLFREWLDDRKRIYATSQCHDVVIVLNSVISMYDALFDCNKTFLEVEEPNSEKIRKGLIALVNFDLRDGSAIAPGRNETKEQALAWLREQAPKSQGKTSFEAIKEEKVDNANKVEPKVKVGDWLVGNRRKDVLLVKTIHCGYVTLEDISGNSYGPCFLPNDDSYYLWTIQDAKDGDVLLSKHNQPFIYNGIFNDENVGAYCGIDSLGSAFIEATLSCNWTSKKEVTPATKGQRALLFEKMREAGYTWDGDKLELKKKVQ